MLPTAYASTLFPHPSSAQPLGVSFQSTDPLALSDFTGLSMAYKALDDPGLPLPAASSLAAHAQPLLRALTTEEHSPFPQTYQALDGNAVADLPSLVNPVLFPGTLQFPPVFPGSHYSAITDGPEYVIPPLL